MLRGVARTHAISGSADKEASMFITAMFLVAIAAAGGVV
jgi:hypothetical protein